MGHLQLPRSDLLGFLAVSPAWSGTPDRAICASRRWSLGSANNGLEGRREVIRRGSVAVGQRDVAIAKEPGDRETVVLQERLGRRRS